MTHQRISILQIRVCEGLAVLVHQLERSAHLGPPDSLVRLCYAFLLHPLLLVFKVPDQATRRYDEQKCGFPGKGLRVVRSNVSLAVLDVFLLVVRRARRAMGSSSYAYPYSIPTLGLFD